VRAFVAIVLLALGVAGAAAAADGEPRKALTKKGQATAQSIVLKRGDLTTAFSARPRSDDKLPAGVRCDALDESDLTVTGDAESPDFALSQPGVYVTVGSTAQVYRTGREASASWKRGSSTQTTTCFADIIRLSAPRGQKVEIVSAKRLAFPKVAPRTVAFRVVAILTLPGNRQVRAYVDAVVLQHGRIQSGLVFTSLGRPVGRSDELGLASVLALRMARAAGPTGPKA
jgi:hypothetical protein